MVNRPAWQRYAWKDLGVIMNRGEELEFGALPDAAAFQEWERRFWARRDPTPTTERNERREEHFKRLEKARKLYPAENALGLDLRGRDYVAFGQPAEIVELEDWFDETGHHPARAIWVWLEPKMRTTYTDWNLDGEWEPAFMEAPSSRPDVLVKVEKAYMRDGSVDDATVLEEIRTRDPEMFQEIVRQVGEGELINPLDLKSEALAAEIMGPRFRRMEGEYFKVKRERRDTYRHDFGVEPLPLIAFAVDCFRGPDGRSRVEVSHQLRSRDLRFDWDFAAQEFRAEIARRVVYFDGAQNRVAMREDVIPVHAESIEDTHSSMLLPGLSAELLPPGDYRLALRLEDKRSGRLQIYTTAVSVPAFPPKELTLSDITFASRLVEGSAPEIFRKGDWIVYPHPLHSYSTQNPLGIYFEIYGLATDGQGLNDYSVTYRIRRQNPAQRSSWLWTKQEVVDAEVGSTFQDRHGGEMARHPLVVSAAEFAEDVYLLEVEVTDRLSGATSRGDARFSVVNDAALH